MADPCEGACTPIYQFCDAMRKCQDCRTVVCGSGQGEIGRLECRDKCPEIYKEVYEATTENIQEAIENVIQTTTEGPTDTEFPQWAVATIAVAAIAAVCVALFFLGKHLFKDYKKRSQRYSPAPVREQPREEQKDLPYPIPESGDAEASSTSDVSALPIS